MTAIDTITTIAAIILTAITVLLLISKINRLEKDLTEAQRRIAQLEAIPDGSGGTLGYHERLM